MKESPLINKSKAFALEVLKVCKELRATKCEGVLINQFIRSGTSIGANIREAFYAHIKADFVSKLQIALKECYSVIKGVPVLLPEKTNPDWSRELIEIIFWEHHDVISKIYEEIERDNVADWNEVYLKNIKEIHGTKENILKDFFQTKRILL